VPETTEAHRERGNVWDSRHTSTNVGVKAGKREPVGTRKRERKRGDKTRTNG